MKSLKQENIASLPLKRTATVSSVKNQSRQMLELLDHYKIAIGTKLRVNKRFEFDGCAEIRIEKQPLIIVSAVVAQNVYCIL